METFVHDSVHNELLERPDAVQVSEMIKIQDGRHVAEEFLEDLLPLPYGLDATGESAPEDLAMFVLQHIVAPYL